MTEQTEFPSVLQSEEDKRRQKLNRLQKDYEPEQAYGTHHDIREHIKHGGNIKDY